MHDALKGLHFFTRFAYSFSALGYRRRRRQWQEAASDFDGQRWLVTGASGGIGRAIALGAAERQANVLAVARSTKKLTRLAADAGAGIVPKRVDLSLTTEINRLLDDLADDNDARPFNVLVNNVGVLLNEHETSAEGHELSFATNLLNHYVLTTGLIERGLLAEDAIVINMSSGGMYNVRLAIDRLNTLDTTHYDGVLAYAYQKRAQVVLNEQWRKQHATQGPTFYVMHPGWVDTEGVKTSLPGFRALFQHVLRDAEAGADTALWLAAARPLQDDDGSIWFDREEHSAHMDASTHRDADESAKLIDYLEGRATV
jgi:dehydrogenase/reductase SDR family protein 12